MDEPFAAGRAGQRIIGQTAKACRSYGLIHPGDRICLGLSGGKDSLALLWALARLRSCYGLPFEFVAVTLDPGWPGIDAAAAFAPVARLCADLRVDYSLVPSAIGRAALGPDNRKSPCSLCARLRRAALVGAAKAAGCTVLALAHHMDDAIETFLMSLFYEGRIACFSPAADYEDSGVRVVRPLVYLEEAEIARFARRAPLPIVANPCPVERSGTGARARMKALVRDLRRGKRDLRATLFGALGRSGIPGW
jgi:tRNA(Ile)-lysidine synthase TilS/MesJ